ncbi:MAG: hypothetical protein JRJ39_00055 [Deltaproteobacteria bacterium]|nr:hypothetical protein [Deltaproteobacteria bacterium]
MTKQSLQELKEVTMCAIFFILFGYAFLTLMFRQDRIVKDEEVRFVQTLDNEHMLKSKRGLK